MSRRGQPTTRLGTALVAVVALALVASIVGFATEGTARPGAAATTTTSLVPTTTSTTVAPTTTSLAPTTTSLPPPSRPLPLLGVYAGPGNTVGAGAFDRLLGGRAGRAFDFLDDATWFSMTQPSWLVGKWSVTRFNMTFAVPLLPSHSATLRAEAAGAYDAEFVRLARFLVWHREGRATILLGWSPLGGRWHPWSVRNHVEALRYDASFRNAVRAMRSVPGAHFAFTFEPGPGGAATTVTPLQLFPGRAYASEIAFAIVDKSWGGRRLSAAVRFARILAGRYGPDYLHGLVRRLHVPLELDGLALATRATNGGGDDPSFVRFFLRWSAWAHVRTVVAWDFGPVALDRRHAPRAFFALQHAVVR